LRGDTRCQRRSRTGYGRDGLEGRRRLLVRLGQADPVEDARLIEAELEERLADLEKAGKLLEAQRLRMRTTYDIEMMRQVGFCSGIENYSRFLDGRAAGQAPYTLEGSSRRPRARA